MIAQVLGEVGERDLGRIHESALLGAPLELKVTGDERGEGTLVLPMR